MSSSKIVEGIFAVNKPQGFSSAEVLETIKNAFNPSKLFAPWIKQAAEVRDENQKYNKKAWRNKSPRMVVKMGHGGTLDPLATGVLIVAIGKYTKELSQFLHCTKTYDATVLFGCATTSYDRLGEVIKKKPHGHITRDMVEEALNKFKGKIMQRPPIYSALRYKGKRLYEYAREGKELPVDIKDREVQVHELTLLDWYPGGTHHHRYPLAEAAAESKLDANALLESGPQASKSPQKPMADGQLSGTKRKMDDESTAAEPSSTPETKRRKDETHHHQLKAEVVETTHADPQDPEVDDSTSKHDSLEEDDGSQAPAARIRMTVSSGFYVRSLCHDLGEAVGSNALMSELVRTRQAQFQLGENVFEYDELQKGEDIWGPQVEQLLDTYTKAQ